MKEENNSEDIKIDIENKKEETKKISFWKSLWYSITKIENYPEMAATGLGRAMSYMSKVVAILAILLSLGIIGLIPLMYFLRVEIIAEPLALSSTNQALTR